jgi:hypothetical protein
MFDDVERRNDIETAVGERRIDRVTAEDLGCHGEAALAAATGSISTPATFQPTAFILCRKRPVAIRRPANGLDRSTAESFPGPCGGAEAPTRARRHSSGRTAHGRSLAVQQRRNLRVTGMRGVVVRVGAIELMFANARILMKKSASAAARQGERSRHAERDVTQPAKRDDITTAAERTRDNLEFERECHGFTHPGRIALITGLADLECTRAAQDKMGGRRGRAEFSLTTSSVGAALIEATLSLGILACPSHRPKLAASHAAMPRSTLCPDPARRF